MTTSSDPQSGDGSEPNRFAQWAGEPRPCSLAQEFWQFLRYNKKWWLLPIVLLLFLATMLIVLGSTGAGPFLYTLF